MTVVHGQHEVEEVGLPEVGGRLLLKVGPSQSNATGGRESDSGALEGEARGTSAGEPVWG